jgi:hypothetical protein
MNITIAAALVALAIAVVVGVFYYRWMTREIRQARARGRELAKRVWAAYQQLKTQSNLSVEERRVRSLLASGRPEEDVRSLVVRNTELSTLHASLTMLTVSIAVQAERAMPVTPEALRKNIVVVQRAVMDVIPMEA